jgi:hypothetical protein
MISDKGMRIEEQRLGFEDCNGGFMIKYGEIRFVDLRLRIEEIRVRQIKKLNYPELVPQPLF